MYLLEMLIAPNPIGTPPALFFSFIKYILIVYSSGLGGHFYTQYTFLYILFIVSPPSAFSCLSSPLELTSQKAPSLKFKFIQLTQTLNP